MICARDTRYASLENRNPRKYQGADHFTWIAKYLNAGMGIKAAIKNANMLLNDVRNTLTPVVARHKPTSSCSKTSENTVPNDHVVQ